MLTDPASIRNMSTILTFANRRNSGTKPCGNTRGLGTRSCTAHRPNRYSRYGLRAI